MPQIIDTTPDIPFYRQRTTLDGRDYVLTFTWNERNGRWYMDVNDQDDSPIATGVKLVTGWPLLRLYRDERLPPGSLLLLDMEAQEGSNPLDPALCNLGERFKLTYTPAEELAGLLA
jgi:hypothetical protein